MAYIGKTPSQATRARYYFTATGGETSLSGADDNANTLVFSDGNYVDVILNGVTLVAGTDYNTTTANTIGGLSALVASDIVEIVVYDTFSVFGGDVVGNFSLQNGNLSLGDNDKAIFGAGSDLQIYHDGSNSYITDAGTGTIHLRSDNEFRVQNVGGTANYLYALNGGLVRLYYNNSGKLDTTSTGIDVTGTVTADGLTVEKNSAVVASFNRGTDNGSVIEIQNNGAIHGQLEAQSGKSLVISSDPGNIGGSSFMGFEVDGSERLRIDSSGNVGIGTGSPNTNFVVLKNGSLATHSGVADFIASFQNTDNTAQNAIIGITSSTSGNAKIHFGDTGNVSVGVIDYDNADNSMRFSTNTAEAMRINSAGTLMVGTTDTDPSNNGAGGAEGVAITGGEAIRIARSGGGMLLLNRMDSDGEIAVFRKDGSTVGSIGTSFATLYMGHDDTAIRFRPDLNCITPSNDSGGNNDNFLDWGYSTIRWDDIYATNGTIQTSDRNEKQDIEELSEAEQRVAVACKSLLRKFRWKDKVAQKGDDARIHFGIIAQDLQAAFEAEGLDAGRYAMFISSTWWETQTEVPAVAEEVDEDGNVITEAKEAYTRTDTYHTAEEAPEGATERTRLGVRYPELLAFIIAAI